jgi:SRSO17 transposase
VTGFLTDLPRKNCEAIAQAVADTSWEQWQHLLTDATWDPLALDEQRVRRVVERSPANGVLVLDETGLPKQGKSSVGVQHPSSGTDAASQATANSWSAPSRWSMIQARASRGDFPLSARLSLPEIWAEDRERRQSAHVPETVTFASKPEVALQLLERAQAWSVPEAPVVTAAG